MNLHDHEPPSKLIDRKPRDGAAGRGDAGIIMAITLIYGLLSWLTQGSIDTVFWNLFYLSSAVFLIPYIVLMLVFLKLRKADPSAARPYRVPGPNWWIHVLAWVPLIIGEVLVRMAHRTLVGRFMPPVPSEGAAQAAARAGLEELLA